MKIPTLFFIFIASSLLTKAVQCQSQTQINNVLTVFKPDKSQFSLSCLPSTVVLIHSVFYGRAEFSCNDSAAFTLVSARCNLQRNCSISVPVSPRLLDNCPALVKYIQIAYECVQPTAPLNASDWLVRRTYRRLNGVYILPNCGESCFIGSAELSSSSDDWPGECMEKCEAVAASGCALFVLDSGICMLYNQNAVSFASSYQSSGAATVLYQKRQSSTGSFPRLLVYSGKYQGSLMHYWPVAMHVNNLIDSGKRLYSENPTLCADRFGRPLSAFRVSDMSNVMRAPPGVYFSVPNKLTVMFWVNVWQLPSGHNSAFLMDFGDLKFVNDVCIFLSNSKQNAMVTRNNEFFWRSPDQTEVVAGTWMHMAVVFDVETMTIYFNGKLQGSRWANPVQVIPRTSNFFGHGNFLNVVENMGFDMDEVMFFGVALSEADIQMHYRNDQSYINEM